MIVPPYAGVTLVEFRDRIELTPYYWVREFIGLGRMKASEVGPFQSPMAQAVFRAMSQGGDVWVIVRWLRYEDGREEPININFLDSEATEERAREELDKLADFANMTKQELLDIAACFEASEEDLAYIENRFPDIKSGPPPTDATDEFRVYQARLKVLGGFQPKTVALIRQADDAKSAEERKKLEREAVQAYFAEMAEEWTEDLVLEWQRSNPVGTKWMIEFARVMQEPERRIDDVNYELVLNWLRRKYNLMTAEELSDAILIATGQRVIPATLRRRRARLGLDTDRSTGPDPKSDQ